MIDICCGYKLHRLEKSRGRFGPKIPTMSSHSRKSSVNKPESSEQKTGKLETTEEKVNASKELPIGKPQAKAPTQKAGKKKKIEGAALIGIDVAKEDDFSGWYQQVLLKGDMLDYYDVSGCYILKVRKSSSTERLS
jgi:prolyl-tRNA synthetase